VSLVEAQAAVSRAARTHGRAGAGQEFAVLVAVEFTGQRRKLTSAARLARDVAAMRADAGENDLEPHSESHGGVGADLDFAASLAEFEELARSAGAEIAATLVQRRAKPDAATLVGQGKLDEIAGVAASTGADVVLFDHDLTPSQLRNLEAKLPCRVIDRTQLILDIFARHARTREGQLQVELAQLEYQLPRLGRARQGNVAARRRHWDTRPGRDAVGDRSQKDQSAYRSREGTARVGAADSATAEAATRGCSGARGGAGRLHQRGQEHAVQCADGSTAY
jgi:hypothetical protein